MSSDTFDPDNTVFRTREPRSDGKTDHFFNRPGDGGRHGHVVESPDSTPSATQYDYVRDLDGNEYGPRTND